MKKTKKKIIITSRYEVDENDSFQTRWLTDVMNHSNLNMTGSSKILHVTRQVVRKYVYNEVPMKYPVIYTICHSLNLEEDPVDIFNKIKEDNKNG